MLKKTFINLKIVLLFRQIYTFISITHLEGFDFASESDWKSAVNFELLQQNNIEENMCFTKHIQSLCDTTNYQYIVLYERQMSITDKSKQKYDHCCDHII